MRPTARPGGKRLFLARLQSRLLDLVDLITQQIQPPRLEGFVHVRCFKLAADGAVPPIGVLIGRPQGQQSPQPIQILHVSFRREEGLIFVLSVDIDKQAAHRPQHGNRRGPAVDMTGSLAVGGEAPLYEQGTVFVRLHPHLRERLQSRP